jgi:tyrosinase
MILWRRFIANVRDAKGRVLTYHSTHINYTLNVHLSGLFLPWHRHFLWLWEKALREECGYPGHLP